MAGVFAGDDVVTAAILDRFVHHGTAVNIRGQSYWLNDKLKAMTTDTASPATQRRNEPIEES